ncbi:MAG: type I methionyl aminopeptidase [Patescibacteria group bacterium]|nr:type I methionyl aminopeptidase [Patescibacteria group bacterium]
MLDKKSAKEIEILQEGGAILASILHKLAARVEPGISGQELDELAESCIKQAGGRPAFKNYKGFPSTLCVSVNDTVVHGIPSDKPFQEGDLVGLDLGLEYKGLYTDMALTVGVGNISQAAQDLLLAAKKALSIGLSQIKPGKEIGDIGRAIEKFIQPLGYGIVRDLAGHGVGRAIHENPTVPNYDTRSKTAKMFAGMVLAIEPMITLGGDYRVLTAENNWDIKARDGSLTAHFEHSVAVTENGCLILTQK